MVKISVLFVLMFSACFLVSCNIDFPGLFASGDLDERLKERNNFRFLSPSDLTIPLGEEYSFIVLNDTHIENGDALGLEKLNDVIKSNKKIKFVVFNGDISQNGKRQDIEKFIEIAKEARSLEVPYYPVIGNHDVFFGNWTVWKELIGSTCYRVNGGSAKLLFIDSANAYFGNDQLDWLERELKNSNGRVFVFTHVNLFGETPVEPQFTDTRERAKIVSMLKGRADIMFTGHSHRRNETEAGGVRYITIEEYRDYRVYCLVSVTKNSVSCEFKKL